MKKILLSVFTLLTISGSAIAQQVANGGFEVWGPSTYASSDPVTWGTTNLDNFGAPVSTTQVTTGAYEGTSYVKMTTTSGYLAVAGVDVLPGLVLSNGNLVTGPANSAYTDRPLSVMFTYKSAMVASDTGGVYMELTLNTNLVGAMYFPVAGTSSSWQTVNVPVYYFTTDTPDSMLFMGASSVGDFNLANVTPEVGSVLDLDAVTICQQLNPSFTATVSFSDVDFAETTTATGPNLMWDFGDGNNSTSSNPSHTYASNGSYTVSLTVTDSCGNDSTVTQMVTIFDDSGVESGIANSTFTIYPNPSSSVFNINLEMAEAREISAVLYDLSGRKVMNVYEGNTDLLQTQIDGTELELGTYILKISSADGFIQKKITVLK